MTTSRRQIIVSRDVFLDQLNLNNTNKVVQQNDEKTFFLKHLFLS
jgi:hypothetical protein